MKFMCIICAERVMEHMSEAEAARHYEEYRDFTESIRASGHLVDCNRLLPPATATTLRVRDGQVSTTDGPFAETRELFGGYYLIETRDLAEALRIAARIPGAKKGCVEVREVAADAETNTALGRAAR
jgi:hypothetical protein